MYIWVWQLHLFRYALPRAASLNLPTTCFASHWCAVNLCISTPLRSPPDLSALFAHLWCDPSDLHHFRENRCKPHPSPSVSWGHTEAHRRLGGPSATSVLISSDIRVSPQSLWSCQGVGWDELMADGLFIPQSPDLSLPHRPRILNWQQHILKCDCPGAYRYSGLSAFYF